MPDQRNGIPSKKRCDPLKFMNENHTHTHTQTQRHRDTETPRHRDTETQIHRDTETERRRDAETHIHRETETQRHRDTETQRHRDTETQSHRETQTQRHRDGETQGHRNTKTRTAGGIQLGTQPGRDNADCVHRGVGVWGCTCCGGCGSGTPLSTLLTEMPRFCQPQPQQRRTSWIGMLYMVCFLHRCKKTYYVQKNKLCRRSENAGSVWRSSVGDFEGRCDGTSVLVESQGLGFRV